MKTNTVYKRAYNRCLDRLAELPAGGDLGSETELSDLLGVSRTTVRAVLSALAEARLIALDGRGKTVLRAPKPQDYFPDFETESVGATVEKKFMEWVLKGDCRPGQHINSLDLARQFGVSTSAIRNYLGHFNHFGLLKKSQNGGWMFRGFTEDFALELSEVRELFEHRSVQRFIEQPPDSPVWRKLDQIERQHLALLDEIDQRFTDFSDLDERFHRLINDAASNRFIGNFYDIISMIFHYHYQWNKAEEKERNAVAIQEHLACIAALKSRDREAVTITFRAHLKTARTTLLRSLSRIDAHQTIDAD
ncbi:GntR family transcriptional regulator [Azospirillum thermophilum]|uniref:GntR family transcriptional regulator n=1 Tax=Azospirillum thermophilum TaxID=2202148 RepID=A0A2S2CWJ3_9PROT|nr:GntR family transcriptional regulator [Azospirillum thermophilum]AWK88770.1 GntR family transcriptional regulator [Azospirillum thermophilum]